MDTWPIFCSSFQLAGHNGRVGEGKDRQELLLQDPFCHGFGVFGFGEFKCRPPFLKTQEMVVYQSQTLFLALKAHIPYVRTKLSHTGKCGESRTVFSPPHERTVSPSPPE